jgi:glycosyltransferase involved in cell wall biosynthesis
MATSRPRFSLILATRNRDVEISRLLDSLTVQTNRDFRLIVVDQNPDERLAALFDRYRDRVDLLHLASTPGLSHARNQGLRYAEADLIAFPDDDCWYPPQALATVDTHLKRNSRSQGLCGRALDGSGRARGRWARRPKRINRYNIFGCCISFTIFLRREAVEQIGRFDETLGLGARSPWQGGEDYDYLLRASRLAGGVDYDPALFIHHPPLTQEYDDTALAKRIGNALGFGRFLRLQDYPPWFVRYYSTRYLADALRCLAQGDLQKAHYRWSTLIATLEAYRGRIGICANSVTSQISPSLPWSEPDRPATIN